MNFQFLLGTLLTIGMMLFIPSIQQIIQSRWGILRKWQSISAVIMLGFFVIIAFPTSWYRFVFGSLFVGIAIVMIFLVPKYESVKKWIEDSFLTGENLVDQNPKIIQLIQWPLLFFGFGIMPWVIVLIGICISLATYHVVSNNKTMKDSVLTLLLYAEQFYKRSNNVQKKQDSNLKKEEDKRDPVNEEDPFLKELG